MQSEVNRYSYDDLAGYSSRITVFVHTVSTLVFKKHTINVHLFLTVMIYYPLFFREHNERFSKWLHRVTISQWLLTLEGGHGVKPKGGAPL